MNSAKGVIIRKSPYIVKETVDRLLAFLQLHDITLYARIDQQTELRKVGQAIAPIEFILFGNPKAGGPVMVENPLAALDLPMKIIVWEDEYKEVWVAYNDAFYIKERYALSAVVGAPLDLDPLVSKILV